MEPAKSGACGIEEQRVKLAADLYAARKAARDISGDQYQERIVIPMETIQNAAAKWEVDKLNATIKLCKMAADEEGSGLIIMWYIAAYVELVEARKA